MPSGWITSRQLQQWRQAYEAADVIRKDVDLGGIEWKRCISSSAKRAHVTAQASFSGQIVTSPNLREVEFQEFRTGALPLPFWMWRWLLRVAWMTSHSSQRVARDEFLARIRCTAKMLAAQQEDTLVVCHAGVMAYLRKELLKVGFTGPKFSIAEHARLYVFEKKGGGWVKYLHLPASTLPECFGAAWQV